MNRTMLVLAALVATNQRGVAIPNRRNYTGSHDCSECGAKFNGRIALNQHTKAKHGKRSKP